MWIKSTYATIATDIDANVTAICNQARNVLSLAKNTFGSIFTGTDLGLDVILLVLGATGVDDEITWYPSLGLLKKLDNHEIYDLGWLSASSSWMFPSSNDCCVGWAEDVPFFSGCKK